MVRASPKPISIPIVFKSPAPPPLPALRAFIEITRAVNPAPMASKPCSTCSGSRLDTFFKAIDAIAKAILKPTITPAAFMASCAFTRRMTPAAPNKPVNIAIIAPVAIANLVESIKVIKNIDPANTAIAIAIF